MSESVRIILVLLAAGAGVTLVIFLLIGLFTVVKSVVTHLARFIGAEVKDTFRVLGSLLTAIVYALLLLGNIVIGRWSAAAHFGRGVRDEIGGGARALYRVVVGNPARLLMMDGLVEGIEDRLPAMVAAAPGTDGPSKRTGQFEGYKILGSLPTGGSGSRLYVAEPDDLKRAGLERAGHRGLANVVIKCFSLSDGSSLPQIVRESRALDAAMKLGLILDHDLSSERFFYVMRYVPGQNLTLVTKQLHAQSGGDGLDDKRLRLALGFVADLLKTLDRYHQGGLWHKDVKPDNIIVEGEAAHLVDFGLITPLRSAMTLTTHGTEYFRDPEMVRLALKGVKVHEVDGTRFDVFGAGAVLYAVLEDAFPAHGVLSPMTKPSPEALKWVVRRAMTDYDRRYASASAMLADVEAVRTAAKPFEMRPVDLPSMCEGGEVPVAPLEVGAPVAGAVGVASYVAASPTPPADSSRIGQAHGAGTVGHAEGAPAAGAAAALPKVVVENWWTGKSRLESGAAVGSASVSSALESAKEAASRLNRKVYEGFAAAGAGAAQRHAGPAREGVRDGAPRRPAAEQIATARARMLAARERAKARQITRSQSGRSYSNGVKGAVALVVVVFLGAVFGLTALTFLPPDTRGFPVTVRSDGPGSEAPVVAGGVPEFSGVAGFSGQAAFVISDLDALDAKSAAEARRGLQVLREAGLKLAGMPVDVHLGQSDLTLPTADIDEMTATLRLARGQAALDSKQTLDSIRAWLLKNSEHFDMVVWLSTEPGGQGEQRLFHFFAFKDAAKPGTVGFTARGLIDGLTYPARRVYDVTIQNGRDVQRMLDDLGVRIASARESVEQSLTGQSPRDGPQAWQEGQSLSTEARDYVLRLINDAGQVLLAVRKSIGDEQVPPIPPADEPAKPEGKPRLAMAANRRRRGLVLRPRHDPLAVVRRRIRNEFAIATSGPSDTGCTPRSGASAAA
jgi:Protein kinase domain